MAPFTTSANERTVFECPPVDAPTVDDFQFPSWDQLPEDLQNPRSSADYSSAIPGTTTGVSMSDVEGATAMPWDDMDFAMDLDTDLDMNLNQI
jgi:hypothetical protein